LIKAKNALAHIPNVSFIKQKYSQMHAADLLVIATEWDEFNNPDLSKLKLLKRQTVFDGRNMLDKVTLEDAGIEYFA
jgi:UDPglucose 6-dehydrogenase